jgi:hypothetical protein
LLFGYRDSFWLKAPPEKSLVEARHRAFSTWLSSSHLCFFFFFFFFFV